VIFRNFGPPPRHRSLFNVEAESPRYRAAASTSSNRPSVPGRRGCHVRRFGSAASATLGFGAC